MRADGSLDEGSRSTQRETLVSPHGDAWRDYFTRPSAVMAARTAGRAATRSIYC